MKHTTQNQTTTFDRTFSGGRTFAGIRAWSFLFVIASLTVVMTVSCAEKRDPSFGANGEERNIISLADLQNTAVAVSLNGESVPQSDRLSFASASEAPLFKVGTHNSPEQLSSMFKGLVLAASGGSSATIKFMADKKFLTAVKVAGGPGQLTAQERDLAITQNGETLVPVFQYGVRAFGVVVRDRNEFGEETTRLRIEPTKWENATHIQISNTTEDRLPVAINPETAPTVLVREKLNGQFLTTADIREKLGVKLAAADTDIFRVIVKPDSLQFFQVSGRDTLSGEDLEVIAAGGNNEISACSKDILDNSPFQLDPSNCFAVLRFSVNATSVAASRPVDEFGIPSSQVVLKPIKPGTQGSLVQIAEASEANVVHAGRDFLTHDPRNSLKVSVLKNNEYLMRRTLEDSPNSFNYVFAGLAGPLEIVRFQFKQDRVEVIRANALVEFNPNIGGNSPVDYEVLMAFPAQFKKTVTVSPNGTPLGRPDIQNTDFRDPDATAIIDWTKNLVPPLSSPLDYYGGLARYCFSSAVAQTVSNIDHKLNDGKGNIHLTLNTTYAGRDAGLCAGDRYLGYFDQAELMYSFAERVSFQFYKSKGDTKLEEPEMPIPFEAQKRLGFGLFTYSKKKPNNAGETNRKGTKVALPSVFDLKNGKQITYVLQGLPQAKPGQPLSREQRLIRATVIRATKDVIADLNRGFRDAFKGTALERSGNVVRLLVAGDDLPTEQSGRLGDLNFNYIYYVGKQTENSIIGLGGSHANPRSGTVEAASVFLYGGNMLGAVRGMKRLLKAQIEYYNLTRPEITELPSADSAELYAGDPTQKVKLAMSEFGSGLGFDSRLIKLESAKGANQTQQQRAFSRSGSKIQANFERGKQLSADKMIDQGLSMSRTAMALKKAMEVAVKDAHDHKHAHGSTWGSQAAMERLFALNPRERGRYAQVIENLERDHICVKQFDVESAANAMAGQITAVDDSFESDLEWMIAMWKPTLAHEIGHNLGLRHNFQGSVDKANWKLNADDPSERNYSSVMDYLVDDHFTYDGLGPHDVAALRFAYTGLMEVNPALQNLISTVDNQKVLDLRSVGGPQVPLKGDGFIDVNTYKELLGLEDWADLTLRQIQQTPITRPYKFCSDEDTVLDPTCGRFDQGTTAQEIVQFYINDYNSTYSLRNFPQDRIDFVGWKSGNYIGRLFSKMIPIRQMLEETFYQLIYNPTGVDGAYIDYLQAALDGMYFFHTVVRTPEVARFNEGLSRFKPYQRVVRSNGKNYLVKLNLERKWSSDIAFDLDDERISVRGTELDKAIALILLTERNMGFPRYEAASLRLSFADLERILEMNVPGYEGITLPMLKEVAMDQLTPWAATPLGPIELGEGTFKTSITELHRFYALLGAIVNLDVGNDADFNHSIQFRILGKKEKPLNVPSITRPGTLGDLHYAAMQDSAQAIPMIERGAIVQSLQPQTDELSALFADWTKEATAANPDNGKLEQIAQAVNTRLASLPESAGMKTMNQIGGLLLGVIGLAEDVEDLRGKVPPVAFAETVEEFTNLLNVVAKDNPAAAIALQTLNGGDDGLKLPVIEEVRPDGVTEGQLNNIFANSEFLSKVFLMLNDQYNNK